MKNFMGAIILLALLAGVAFADLQFSNYSVAPSTIKPDSSGTVTLLVSNPGAESISNVKITSDAVNPIISSESKDLGDFSSGASTYVTLQFRVEAGAKTGIYNMPINAYWSESTGSKFKSLNVPITVRDSPNLQIDAGHPSVAPSQDFTVEAVITNTGGEAKSVNLQPSSSNFILKGPSPINIGDLPKGGTRRVNVSFSVVSSTVAGTYSIPISATYTDNIGTAGVSTLSFGPVEVIKNKADFIIEVTPSTTDAILPGEKVGLNVQVRNVGGEDAYNVRIKVSDSFFTAIGSDERVITEITPGESQTAVFIIGVNNDAAPGYKAVHIDLDYRNAQGEQQTVVEKEAGIAVGCKNDVSVVMATEPAYVNAKGVYTFSVQVANKGLATIDAVSVNMGSSEEFSLLEASDQFLGQILVNDKDNARYKVNVKTDTPGEYQLGVTVSYRDACKQTVSENKTVTLHVVPAGVGTAASNGNGGLFSLGNIVTLLIIAGVAYWGYGKYVKKKK
ncbi:Uncharacterised protein [Candidatus Gugararchaeum adminiculabundum]|nr:Uncharacterised protein [Candidatus Gugararchaeum adminiculabundum]